MKDLPPPAQIARDGALLLDFDGTLVPIAPRPDAARVEPDLRQLLAVLLGKLSGAMAIVTGRTLASLDALLAPLLLPAAGEHGIALRREAAGSTHRATVAPLPPAWREAARALAAPHPGVLVEEKPSGLVVHYRAAPAQGPSLWAAMRRRFADIPGFRLAEAAMAIELRPAGVGKGDAVRALMAAPPFAGRTPIFIGDDVTDEDGIAAARALGGFGLRMDASFTSPARLWDWLAGIAAATDAPAA